MNEISPKSTNRQRQFIRNVEAALRAKLETEAVSVDQWRLRMRKEAELSFIHPEYLEAMYLFQEARARKQAVSEMLYTFLTLKEGYHV